MTTQDNNSPIVRPIGELLQLLKDCFVKRNWNYGGLCVTAYDMYSSNFIVNYHINIDEYHLLILYLKDNKPHTTRTDGYWFPPFKKEPRIQWLDEHIKLNNNENNR